MKLPLRQTRRTEANTDYFEEEDERDNMEVMIENLQE
jgi:hypothetical protein